MTKRQLITGLFLFLKDKKIEGYISDSENQVPLNGATVIVQRNKGGNTKLEKNWTYYFSGKYSWLQWRDAQFDTESRLQFETQPVSEMHYKSGTPRFRQGSVSNSK